MTHLAPFLLMHSWSKSLYSSSLSSREDCAVLSSLLFLVQLVEWAVTVGISSPVQSREMPREKMSWQRMQLKFEWMMSQEKISSKWLNLKKIVLGIRNDSSFLPEQPNTTTSHEGVYITERSRILKHFPQVAIVGFKLSFYLFFSLKFLKTTVWTAVFRRPIHTILISNSAPKAFDGERNSSTQAPVQPFSCECLCQIENVAENSENNLLFKIFLFPHVYVLPFQPRNFSFFFICIMVILQKVSKGINVRRIESRNKVVLY